MSEDFHGAHEWTAEAQRQAERAKREHINGIYCGPCDRMHYDQIWPCTRALCPLWQAKE